MDFDRLAEKLKERGLPDAARRTIRNSKICIIDDKLEDLKGFSRSLRGEGFSNLTETETVASVNSLIEDHFDLILLDLAGVAKNITADDGIGILEQLKTSNPALPIVVITGSSTPPTKTTVLNLADKILDKPILASDLAKTIDEILKHRKDPFWSSLSIMRQLDAISLQLRNYLTWKDRVVLWWSIRSMQKKIINDDESIVDDILRVGEVVTKMGLIAIRIKATTAGFLKV